MAGSVNRSLRCTCPLDDIDFFEQLWLRSPVIMSRAVPVVRHGDTVDPAQERRGKYHPIIPLLFVERRGSTILVIISLRSGLCPFLKTKFDVPI